MAYQLTKEGLKDAFSSGLNLRAPISHEKLMNYGVDNYYDCYIIDGSGNDTVGKASDYWKQTDPTDPFVGTYTLPSSLTKVLIQSRPAYSHSFLTLRCHGFPDLSKYSAEPYSTFLNFGLGAKDLGNGAVWFSLKNNNQLYAMAGGIWNDLEVEITSLLPADYMTAWHRYSIIMTENIAEFFVDYDLVAIAILGITRAGYVDWPNPPLNNIVPPPYGILWAASQVCKHQPAFISLKTTAEAEIVWSLAPHSFRVGEIPPIIPRVFWLFKSGTSNKLVDVTVTEADTSVTSAPIPLFGYASKTFYFRADQAGTLDIEILTETGNWRTYDSFNIRANTLEHYTMLGDAVLGRIVFTPSTYDAIISEAEVVVR